MCHNSHPGITDRYSILDNRYLQNSMFVGHSTIKVLFMCVPHNFSGALAKNVYCDQLFCVIKSNSF